MEREEIKEMISCSEYSFDKLNIFDEYEMVEKVSSDYYSFFEKYQSYPIKSDTCDSLKAIDPNIFTFEFIFENSFNDILLKLMSQYHSFSAPNQDLIYLLEIRNFNLFHKKLNQIKSSEKNNGESVLLSDELLDHMKKLNILI